MDFHRKNHYVPQTYLKRWAFPTDVNKIWEYWILVEHENVSLWKESSIKLIANHLHLYTRIVAGNESDELERWFDREFETPVQNVLQKVISDNQLTPSDWRVLVRFLSVQDLRTPARLIENLQWWNKTMPKSIEKIAQNTIQNLESIRARGEEMPDVPSPLMENFPIRSRTEIKPEQEFGTLQVNVLVGRELWLSNIKHLLTKTAEVLHQHRWTILSPPKGTNWFTTDAPVVRLNYQSLQNYNFDGGWASKGTEIFMPLSPSHLLYTKVGERSLIRDSRVSHQEAAMIRRCIAEHAHRSIFASEQDTDVAELRPRTVNAGAVESEKAQWENLNKDQIEAEQKFRAG
jgi:Protein of unknown function (DUF4238)